MPCGNGITVDIDDTSGGLHHLTTIPMAIRDPYDLLLAVTHHRDVRPDATAIGGGGREMRSADGDGNGWIGGAQGGDKPWQLGIVWSEAHDSNHVGIVPGQRGVECE